MHRLSSHSAKQHVPHYTAFRESGRSCSKLQGKHCYYSHKDSQLGTVGHAYNPNLDYIVKSCLNKTKNNKKKKEEEKEKFCIQL